MSQLLSWLFYKKKEPEMEEEESDIDLELVRIRHALAQLNTFLLEKKIGLADFFKQQKQGSADFNHMVDQIIRSLQKNAEFPYSALASFTFHKITRMQCLKTHLERIQKEVFTRERTEFPLKTRKMLIWTLLKNCTEELRLQLLLLLSQFCPIPLLSLSEIQDDPSELKYNITPEIYWILKPMPALLCIDIGPKKHTKTINRFFGTKFDEDSLLDYGSVDIQFDLNFKSPRGFSVLKTDHYIQKKFLHQCVKFSSIYLLIVRYDALEDSLPLIVDFCQSIEETSQNVDDKPFFLVITDLPGQNFAFDQESSNTFKQQHGLENFLKLNILALPDKDCSNYKTISNVTKECLIQDIQGYLALDSPRGMNHVEFLHNFQVNNYEEENQLVEDFLTIIENNHENFYNKTLLPMYCYYSKYCQTARKIRDDTQIWQNQNQYDELSGELAVLENIMRGKGLNEPVKPTDVLHQFMRVLSKDNSFLLIYAISNRLKRFIDQRIAPERKLYFDTKDQHHRFKSDELATQISNLQERIEQKTLSLEIIWRELAQFYCYQDQTCFDFYGEQRMMQTLSKYTEKGLPFEILDGDNIRLSEKFFKAAVFPRHRKVLVISIIGPQSSGKSTLLNYLRGCQFATSSGRCTKGIYGTLFDCSIGDYDGLLLLDTEGLFSPEKADPEFDRKIVLFCFAVSHIVLINVRGDLNRHMQEVLAISLNVLDELKVSKVPSPTIFFVLNQNPDLNVENHLIAFNKIVESLSQEVDISKMLNISVKTLVVLPSAFSDKSIYDDGKSTKWIRLRPSDVFGNECSSLRNKIWEEVEMRLTRTEDYAPFSNIQEWNNFAQDIWSTIENFKGLIYLNEIKEIRQQEKVRTMIIDFVRGEFEEETHARELQQQILMIVRRNEKKEEAELQFEAYWEQKIAAVKPSWQASLKELRLTPAVNERADYLFRSHVNIQKSISILRLHSQLEEIQTQNDIINGEARIKQRIRSILNDHSHEITEKEAIISFEQVFSEITYQMEDKQSLGKIQFKLRSELYTQYHTVCSKLPELSVVSECSPSIAFDTACFSHPNTLEPDIFSQDIFKNNYLNLQQLSRVEPKSSDGVRIILALFHTRWNTIFHEIRSGTKILCIHRQLSQELQYIGLDLTGHCYKELGRYQDRVSQNIEPPHPKNNWFTIISKKIHSKKIDAGEFFDTRNYYKGFERYEKKGEVREQKKFLRSILSSLGLNQNHPIQKEHTTYSANGNFIINRWLINSYIFNTPPLENLISYCIARIESNRIETAIRKIVRTETLNDSPQVTTTSLKLISGKVQILAEQISKELAQLGLTLTLPGEGKLHEYALKEILKIITGKTLEDQRKNLKIWIQEKERLKDFFISQVMVEKSEKADKASTQSIVRILQNKILSCLKAKAQAEYNVLLEKNQELFTRETFQNLADAHLIDSNRPDLVFDYIIDPVSVFKQEFEICWTNFLHNCSKDILRIYQTAHYSIGSCIDFFKDIREQLKKIYSNKDEKEIFIISLRDGVDFSEEFSKSVRQAQLEAPFKCLGLFLNGEDFRNFQINGLSIKANLPLVWNAIIEKDEIQREVFNSLSTNESYQTFNLHGFLHQFILQLEQLSEKIKNIAFETLGLALQKNEMKLLAVGCTQTCPVCGRICDVRHGSDPGCLFDKHECKKGHQYQAMKGVRYITSKEAVLETCNDGKNETAWIWRGKNTTWGELKELEELKEWNYDTLPSEQAILNGKFYRAWMIAGERICQHYKIIHHNHFGKKY